MKRLLEKLDPYHQSFAYFEWGFWSWLFFIGAVWWLCAHPQGNFADNVLNNVFVYLPNYLTHEFSHQFWCPFGWEWWCYACGNGMETLIPLVLCFVALRVRGGHNLDTIKYNGSSVHIQKMDTIFVCQPTYFWTLYLA